MAALKKLFSFSSSLKLFGGVQNSIHRANQKCIQNMYQKNISTTTQLNGLMEFFDDEKNWGKTEVKSGRSWKLEELRLKSNTDLHKLWYVLLKERNMLLTMEEEAKDKVRVHPNPERFDKVEESMENLEAVVRERNRAYFELETGESGERKVETVTGPFGLPAEHQYSEYLIPKHLNKKWLEEHTYDLDSRDVKNFLRKYKEQEMHNERKRKNREFNHVIMLLKRFPNMDMEALKEQYPEVDIERAKRSRKCRGHFVPK